MQASYLSVKNWTLIVYFDDEVGGFKEAQLINLGFNRFKAI